MFTVTCHLIVGKITVNSEETHSVGSRSMFYFAFEYVHLIICTEASKCRAMHRTAPALMSNKLHSKSLRETYLFALLALSDTIQSRHSISMDPCNIHAITFPVLSST